MIDADPTRPGSPLDSLLCQRPSAATPGPSPCAALLQEIADLVWRDQRAAGSRHEGVHGLAQRFREQLAGQGGPGSRAWQARERAIRDQQNVLLERLRRFEEKGCDKGDRRHERDIYLAMEWATKPAPSPQDWKGPPAPREPVRIHPGELGASLADLQQRATAMARMFGREAEVTWDGAAATVAIGGVALQVVRDHDSGAWIPGEGGRGP